MELRQLRYFVTVADELHFGRAAEKLHMSQPPLSVQVNRLEQELGMQLFERSTRRVTLTAAGKHLRDRARDLLAEAEAVRAEMHAYADGLAGEVAVGFVSSANYTVLPGVTRQFRKDRPQVTLTLSPLTSGEQLAALTAGTLDVAIVRDELPIDPHMQVDVVFEERIVVCLPQEHPLAGRAEIEPLDLVDAPMISYPRALMPGYIDRLREVLDAAGRGPRIAQEVVHQETALAFVAAGAGISVLPESVRQLVPPSIAVIPLAGAPLTRLLAVRSGRPARRALEDAFVRSLMTAAEAESFLESQLS